MESRKLCKTIVIIFSIILLSATLGFAVTSVKAQGGSLPTKIENLTVSSPSVGEVTVTGQIHYSYDGNDYPLNGTIANNIVGTIPGETGQPDFFSVSSDNTGNFQFTGIIPIPSLGTYEINVKYSGGDTEIVSNISYVLAPSPSVSTTVDLTRPQLTVTLSPSSLTVTPGNSASVQVSVTTNVYGMPVDLAIPTSQPCPAGWTCSFSSSSGTVSYPSYTLTSTLTVTAPSDLSSTGYSWTLGVQAQQGSTTPTIESLTVYVNALTERTANTELTNLYAQYDGQTLYVTGTIEYENPGGNYEALPNAPVLIGNPEEGPIAVGASSSWIGNVTSDQNGDFAFDYPMPLNPGQYSVAVAYEGCSSSSSSTGCYSDSQYYYYFNSYSTSVELDIPLTLNLALDNSVVTSIPNGPSSTVTVSVTTNTQTAYTVTLSVSDPSGALDVMQLSASSGSASAVAPFTSKLLLHVSNSTAPGSYTVTITATGMEGSYPVAVTKQLTIVVENNTRSIVITVEGLPSGVQTTLLVDQKTAYSMISSTRTITVSNNTQSIQVTQEIDAPSGDTRYFCSNYQQATTDLTVSTFTFTYVTQYRLKITANSIPAVSGLELVVTANGATTSQNFNPSLGYSEFYAGNTQVSFAFNTTYIHTATVDYNFTGWTDASGKALNSASSPYVVTMDKPYTFGASFSQWVQVTVSSDLPNNMSSTVQVSSPGGGMSSVTLIGGVPFQAGLFPVGSKFQSVVSQDQSTLYVGSGGSTRYTYQATIPASSITLSKHTAVVIHYQPEYKVQVYSQFPNTVLQPSNGTEWVPAGGTATVQVTSDARDEGWIPYVFSGWTGLPQASNETTASFAVAGPMTVSVQWVPNWTYIAIIAGVVAGVTIPSSLIGRRKVRAWRQNRGAKKNLPEENESEEVTKRKFENLSTESADSDMRLYNYIIDKGGSISIPNAMKELNMTREEITDSIGRLKEKQLLR